MKDSTNPVCFECPRDSSCNFPCLEYSNYNIRQHMDKESNNIQNSIKTLDFAKNTDVLKKNNPPVPRVSGFDISDKTGVSFGLKNIKEEKRNMNDIQDFLEYGVENIEWLRVINGKIPYTELIDKDAFKDYLVSENERYCAENCLCETCRSELKEYTEYEEGYISEMYWSCKNGC